MAGDHAEVWIQAPPAPVQDLDLLIKNPALVQEQEHASDELLLLGMMMWMEQGLVLEWLSPSQEKEAAEREKRVPRQKQDKESR